MTLFFEVNICICRNFPTAQNAALAKISIFELNDEATAF